MTEHSRRISTGDAFLHRSRAPLIDGNFDDITSYENLQVEECEGLCGV